jgi:hypothetical protein
VTQPPIETTQSGEAVAAVRTLQSELSNDYSEIRSAEIQLTEAILSAHAVTVAGRDRLHDIQRQLIEAINSPAAALSTPAGERHFLIFLRSKISEIQAIVDAGALTDEDHARLTNALGSGYLLPGGETGSPPPAASPPGAPSAEQAMGLLPALGSALGALPQAGGQGASAPGQGAGGLAGAATPLAGLASGLLGGHDGATATDDAGEHTRDDDGDAAATDDDIRDHDGGEVQDEDEDHDGGEDDDRARPTPHANQEPPQAGHPPAQTRPAFLT